MKANIPIVLRNAKGLAKRFVPKTTIASKSYQGLLRVSDRCFGDPYRRQNFAFWSMMGIYVNQKSDLTLK